MVGQTGLYGATHNKDATVDLRFLKMHGLGNDFVVLDARGGRDLALTPETVRRIGDRHRGVGFDQLIVVKDTATADAALDFWNADGSLSGACGNGTRCVARLVMNGSSAPITLETERGLLQAEQAGEGRIRVNMGAPELTWNRVPLARDIPLDPLPLGGAPAAVGMGNPHCVFFVDDAKSVDLHEIGPKTEHDPLFPQRTNVEVVQVIDRHTIRMRVWERGGMITLACGSGACAVAVAAARRGLTERDVTILLDGGPLEISWRDDGVWMTGPTALTFEGVFSDEFLAAR
ncbi:MAG: diaminopimelate epimerase [Pseudomonadota bacterium]